MRERESRKDEKGAKMNQWEYFKLKATVIEGYEAKEGGHEMHHMQIQKTYI